MLGDWGLTLFYGSIWYTVFDIIWYMINDIWYMMIIDTTYIYIHTSSTFCVYHKLYQKETFFWHFPLSNFPNLMILRIPTRLERGEGPNPGWMPTNCCLWLIRRWLLWNFQFVYHFQFLVFSKRSGWWSSIGRTWDLFFKKSHLCWVFSRRGWKQTRTMSRVLFQEVDLRRVQMSWVAEGVK